MIYNIPRIIFRSEPFIFFVNHLEHILLVIMCAGVIFFCDSYSQYDIQKQRDLFQKNMMSIDASVRESLSNDLCMFHMMGSLLSSDISHSYESISQYINSSYQLFHGNKVDSISFLRYVPNSGIHAYVREIKKEPSLDRVFHLHPSISHDKGHLIQEVEVSRNQIVNQDPYGKDFSCLYPDFLSQDEVNEAVYISGDGMFSYFIPVYKNNTEGDKLLLGVFLVSYNIKNLIESIIYSKKYPHITNVNELNMVIRIFNNSDDHGMSLLMDTRSNTRKKELKLSYTIIHRDNDLFWYMEYFLDEKSIINYQSLLVLFLLISGFSISFIFFLLSYTFRHRKNMAYQIANKITCDLKIRENELKESQRIAGMGGWTYDVSKRRLIWSEEIMTLLQLTENSTYVNDFLGYIKQNSEEFMRFLQIIINNGQFYEVQCQISINDKVKWICFRGRCYDEDVVEDRIKIIRGVGLDIDQKKRSDDLLKKALYTDVLTGFWNRHFLSDCFFKKTFFERKEFPVVAMLVNIFQFHQITSTYGISLGERILQELSSRIKNVFNKGDILVRLDADNFLIIAGYRDSSSFAMHSSEHLLSIIKSPFQLDGIHIGVQPIIGYTLIHDVCMKLDTLLHELGTAVRESRRIGPNSIIAYSPVLEEKYKDECYLLEDLKHAIKNNELVVFYQPIFNLKSHSIISCEALVRWLHPVRGLLMPSTFIHLAEENDLIAMIDYFVLEQAVLDCVRFRAKGHILGVSLNLSAGQWSDALLIDRVIHALSSTGLPPRALTLEITETVAMSNPKLVQNTIEKLHSLGVSVSIDDFGTGCSSLSYLQKFSVQALKIDHSFIDQVEKNVENKVLVKTIIDLSVCFKLYTVSEGVENKEQLDIVAALGGDCIQGYYISLPLSFDDFMKFLQEFCWEEHSKR